MVRDADSQVERDPTENEEDVNREHTAHRSKARGPFGQGRFCENRVVYLVLAVDDVARAEEFYGSAFGWKRSLAWPETYAELELSPDDRLGLYRRDGFAEEAGAHPVKVGSGKSSGTELYVRVDDMDAAIERLREAGARPLSPRRPREWGDEAAYFADLDGNVVAVAQRLSGDERT